MANSLPDQETPTTVVHIREGYDVYIGRPGKKHDG